MKMQSKALSYLSPRAEVKGSPIHGRGLFAIGDFRPGEIVCVKGGYIFTRADLDEIAPILGPAEIQIADDLFVGPRQIDEREGGMIFSNHSCDPNIGVQGQIVFVALRQIAPGQELTHDWATTDDDDYTLTCRCGATTCRGVITGRDWQNQDLQRRYRGMFSWYLQQKIDARTEKAGSDDVVMTPDVEPALATDPSVQGVLDELIRREPIFHRAELGTTRVDFENMTVTDFREVGASGRRYSRDYVLDTLEKRYAGPYKDGWETTGFHCRKLAEDVYLLTYTLVQDHQRKTRRSTIWQHTPGGWKIVYHQGTIVQDS